MPGRPLAAGLAASGKRRVYGASAQQGRQDSNLQPPVLETQLAVRIGLEPKAAAALLLELRDAGLVEPGPSGWRLTPAAETRFGWALRNLGLADREAA